MENTKRRDLDTRIEHPKVFISYAWIDEENTNRVRDFVNRLRKDGIETVFDQANLRPGQSTIHFMETSVHDPSITSVLMLLTPEYKRKADDKTGGVGTETQIISAEVYNDVNNTKFVPVIFDTFGNNLQECLPIYLKSRFFVDLSDSRNYENEYIKLVRALYGVPTTTLQPIGSRPAWVDNPDSLNYEQGIVGLVRQYKERHGEKDTLIKACETASLLVASLREISFEHKYDSNYFATEYRKLTAFRNTFLEVLHELISNDGLFEYLVVAFDKFASLAERRSSEDEAEYSHLLLKILKHELAISVIAVLYKFRRYDVVHKLLSTSYVSYALHEGVSFGEYFYCYAGRTAYSFCEKLNTALTNVPGQKLISGLADFWVHNTYAPMVTSDDFSNADVLIANLSYCQNFRWFPLTYIYLPEFSNWVIDLSVSLTSKTISRRLFALFDVSDFVSLEKEIKKIFSEDSGGSIRPRFGNSFKECPLICDFLRETNILSKP